MANESDVMDIASLPDAIEWQARHAEEGGAPGTAKVIRALQAVRDTDTATGRRIANWQGLTLKDAMPLRIHGGLHNLVLTGEDTRLETVYAELTTDQATIDALVCELVETYDTRLLPWLDGPPQTNEAGRSASLMAGLMWLAEHEPEHFALVRTVLLPKDYVRLWLTGALASDMSDAAGTLWLDEAARGWSDRVLAATGMDRAQMPPLLEGSAPAGSLRAELASRWGLDGEVIVATGGGDAAAGGVGIGAVEDGDAFLSLGTSGQLFVTTDAYRPFPETMVHAFAHALPERWFQMAAMLNGASPLAWFAGIAGEKPGALLGELESEPGAYPAPGSGPLFLPYLAGERTPLNDPHATGAFHGLRAGDGRPAMTRAVLEGVALSFADCLDCLKQAGTKIERMAAIGGGARSDLWLQMIADALNVRVERYAGAETGPAFGAARLARMAATGEDAADVCGKPDVEIAFDPDAGRHAAWQERLQTFRALYRATKDLSV